MILLKFILYGFRQGKTVKVRCGPATVSSVVFFAASQMTCLVLKSSIAFEVKAGDGRLLQYPLFSLFSKLKGGVVEIHLKDMIKSFFIIKGDAIDFFGAIYLKNGMLPEAACRIVFPDGKTIFAKKADMTLEELGDIMYCHTSMIAEKYRCPFLHIPVPDGIDQDVLMDILYSPKKNTIISIQGLLN